MSDGTSGRRTVLTAAGPITVAVADDLVRARGIPYASADRFGLPQPVSPWTGPRPAVDRGPAAPQDPSRLDTVAGAVGADLSTSEDCQVVSVTAPADARDLPVLVWFHGGAYVSGAGEAPQYDADDLAREGIVVVSVTYRLGVLGYLTPPGTDHDNLGLHDQIAALRWVRVSVAAFGGDPDRVTIAGHSAGGDAVVSMMLSADADGLYQRAIVQSAPLGMRIGRSEMVEALRARLGQLLDDPMTASTDEILAAQRELAVLATSYKSVGALPFGTRMGIAPLPSEESADARLAEVARRCELLVGHTASDASPYVLGDPRAMRLTRAGFPGRAVYRLVVRRVTHAVFGRSAHGLAARWTDAGGAAAQYVFGWAPRTGLLGACHSIELPFLFSGSWSDALMLGGQDPDPRLAARMRRTWATFVRDGVAGLGTRSLTF
ncbi:carboxylesterase family protein [Williamsia phyllosphaerae]|uniref:Carboxylic ester hydrolase n=1 Tax=Williamsia phyllosphaerae TaxID=885042 RepID=A0ABQ1UVA1_9NOCA|nr:carboxylesterase family protein [Williamsia phyllosphaerae]GGF25968.1 carboxylic ester hydrolase [Williamsia phyllosphaerae]